MTTSITSKNIGRAMITGVTFALALAFLALATPQAHAALVGQFTFDPGFEQVDIQGNFPNVGLKGNATIGGGVLDVNGSGTNSTGWAVTEGGAYAGPPIVDKTIVSWLTLQGLQNVARAGSALTIDRTSGDHFDGIIYAERQTDRWMNGSSGFSRTTDFVPGFQETAPGQFIQMAITYDDADNVPGGTMTITGYRDGVPIGQYNTGNGSSWSTGDAELFFGLRHGSTGGGPGGLDALIEEGRVYNEVLSQQQLGELTLFGADTGPAVPEPSSAVLGLLALGGCVFVFWRKR